MCLYSGEFWQLFARVQLTPDILHGSTELLLKDRIRKNISLSHTFEKLNWLDHFHSLIVQSLYQIKNTSYSMLNERSTNHFIPSFWNSRSLLAHPPTMQAITMISSTQFQQTRHIFIFEKTDLLYHFVYTKLAKKESIWNNWWPTPFWDLRRTCFCSQPQNGLADTNLTTAASQRSPPSLPIYRS